MENNQPNQVKSIIKVLDNYLSLHYGIHLAGGPGSPSALVANQLEERLLALKKNSETLLRRSGHVQPILWDTLRGFLAARKEQLRGKQPEEVIEDLVRELAARGYLRIDAQSIPHDVPLGAFGEDDITDPWHEPTVVRRPSENGDGAKSSLTDEPAFMRQYQDRDSAAWFQSWRDVLAIAAMVVVAILLVVGTWKYLLSPFLSGPAASPTQSTTLVAEAGNTASLQATQERAESAVRLAEKSLDTAADARAQAAKLGAEVAGLRKEVQTLASQANVTRARSTTARRTRILGPAKCAPGQVRFTDSSRRNRPPTYVCLGA